MEIKVPVANLARNRKTTDGAWGISLCRDWKRPWVFSSAPADFSAGNCAVTFQTDAPAVYFRKSGDFSSKQIRGDLLLFNPSPEPIELNCRIHTGLDMMPAVTVEKSVSLDGGTSISITYDSSVHAANCEKIDFSVEVKKEGVPCYTFNHSWKGKRKDRWAIKPEKTLTFDFEYALYPYRRQLRVKNLFQNYRKALPTSVTYTVTEKESGKIVLKFQTSAEDGHQQIVDIPDIEGTFILALELGEERISKDFTRKRYPWEGNSLGKGRKVYPPFTPMKQEGSTISTVLRDHDLAESGLPRQITVQGKRLLTAPASLIMNGKPLKGDKLKFIEVADDVIHTHSFLKTDGFAGDAHGRWEYDGTLKYDLTIDPVNSPAVNSLVLEIPLATEYAKMVHAMGDGIRNTLYDYLPEGEGEIWNASKVKAGYMPEKFCTYLFLGSPLRGLCFFCENDKGWSWDRETPNLRVVREGETLYLRVNLINKPPAYDKPHTLSFGLLAAPVKPRLPEWRTRWNAENFTLLGTCINWLGAPGSASNIYPPGKDMYFWEMIARGNVEMVPREEALECISRGEKYYEPFTDYEQMKISWKNHVYHNVCGGRFGKSMVFYYNRAVFNALEEYATFSDEWSLKDFPERDFIPSRGEVKIVPCDSYNDFALYWYRKSFAYRNRGVYWDNWFIRPTYNTVMTDAYFNCEENCITPAAGIWAMRELAKRTYQMMCDEGMTPITFPHMTSTSILPMLSFATVQYDWEWKYSTGDVQDRFTRPYTMLVSNGELAGVIPVLLNDHGEQSKDEWTQRSFAGVSLTHELIGNGSGKVWTTLRDQLLQEYLHNPELKVIRYWDDPDSVVKIDESCAYILYAVPAEKAVLIICSYSKKDLFVDIAVNLNNLGLSPEAKCQNFETREVLKQINGRINLPLKTHELIAIEFFGK